jgi:hypothetical protein
VAEAVVVVEVFVAQAQREDALLEEVGKRVLDEVGVAVIGKAGGEPVDEVELGFDFAEQQSAGIGGDGAAIEAGDDLPAAEGLEQEFRGGTVCHGVVASNSGQQGLATIPFMPAARPSRQTFGEK